MSSTTMEDVGDTWKEYAKLLKEAVVQNHYRGVERLLQCESVIQRADEFKERNTVPLCLAIEQRCVYSHNILPQSWGYFDMETHLELKKLCFENTKKK